VLSTLTLIEAESEVSAMRRVIGNGRFAVEANDLGAAGMAHGQRFVSGPHVNVYNAEALAVMAEAGAVRWVVPFELSRAMLEMILAARPAGVETEMLAFGRLALAFSARCFTARAHNLPKDDCGFRCRDYPEGMPLQTQEQKSFLAVNGIQVQSASVYSLLGEIDDLRSLGVDVLRLTPMGPRRGPRARDVAFADSPPSPCGRGSEGEGAGVATSLASSNAINVPSLTLSPTLTLTDLIVPAAGDGTSIVALSDSRVRRESSAWTASPGLTMTSITGTSSKPPMSGILISMVLDIFL